MNKEKLLELYPDYTTVLGPYTRPDGRKHMEQIFKKAHNLLREHKLRKLIIV